MKAKDLIALAQQVDPESEVVGRMTERNTPRGPGSTKTAASVDSFVGSSLRDDKALVVELIDWPDAY